MWSLPLPTAASSITRHDLALKWYEKQGEATYFSVTFSLPEIKFETLTLSFESAQENITKDEKTTNALIFTAKEGEVTAAVQNGADDPVAYGAVDLSGDVTVSFTSDENGAFDVAVNGTEVGTFTNIGGYFMEYLSSASDTPRIPLSFRAETADGDEQIVLMKSLNGQTFLLEDGMVVDSRVARCSSSTRASVRSRSAISSAFPIRKST